MKRNPSSKLLILSISVKSAIKKKFISLSVYYAAILINLSNVEHKKVKWISSIPTKEENPLKS